jgi:hypothetical protein
MCTPPSARYFGHDDSLHIIYSHNILCCLWTIVADYAAVCLIAGFFATWWDNWAVLSHESLSAPYTFFPIGGVVFIGHFDDD